MANSWNLEPGLNHVGAYQVSGAPFATGSINGTVDAQPMEAMHVDFPYVTRWIKVINKDETNPVRVGIFSLSGVTGSFNFLKLAKHPLRMYIPDSGVLDLKVSSILGLRVDRCRCS